MLLKKLLIFLASLSLCAASLAQETMTGTMIVLRTNQVSLVWSPLDGVDGYEIEPMWIDTTPRTSYPTVISYANSVLMQKPRSGHFIYRIRFFNEVIFGDITNVYYGQWAYSTNALLAELPSGGSGSWWAYWKVSPPTDVIVE